MAELIIKKMICCHNIQKLHKSGIMKRIICILRTLQKVKGQIQEKSVMKG